MNNWQMDRELAVFSFAMNDLCKTKTPLIVVAITAWKKKIFQHLIEDNSDNLIIMKQQPSDNFMT